MQLKVFCSVDQVGLKVLFSILIHAENVEIVSVDLDITSLWHIRWSDESTIVVDILVLISFKESTFEDAGVLLRRLIDGDGVISQVE